MPKATGTIHDSKSHTKRSYRYNVPKASFSYSRSRIRIKRSYRYVPKASFNYSRSRTRIKSSYNMRFELRYFFKMFFPFLVFFF